MLLDTIKVGDKELDAWFNLEIFQDLIVIAYCMAVSNTKVQLCSKTPVEKHGSLTNYSKDL